MHQDHHIYYRYTIYSAPYSTCPPGTKLGVRGDSKLVQLYKRGETDESPPAPAAAFFITGFESRVIRPEVVNPFNTVEEIGEVLSCLLNS